MKSFKKIPGQLRPQKGLLPQGILQSRLSRGAVLGFLFFNSFVFLINEVRAFEYTDDQLANAIYLAEGGQKAKKPFGILSVDCDGYDDCRRVCLNTIRNNKERFAKWGYKTHKDYLSFLASRYAPTVNDPTGLNKYWLNNVRSILASGVNK